ncbi:hypothetical protein GHT06_005025 [Daphnia sinensis]|uniref:Uncharacterized protein n=1 Tax=Daphnia sinensis TaxID=1820382 RepID=A0AAD5KFU0_9CRUS|nr:hypothetical protein GHT06_005025 [Daphnia sinensis]
MLAAADLFRLRTTIKRQRSSRVEVEMLSATLADVLERIKQTAAESYIQEVVALNEQAQLAIRSYAQAVFNAGRVLQPQAIAEVVPENKIINHNPIVSGLANSRNHEVDILGTQAIRNITAAQQPTIGALVSNLDGDKGSRNASDEELKRKEVENFRQMDDLLRQSEREKEDLKMAIEREKILAAIDSSKVGVLIGADQLSAHVQKGIREPIEEDRPTAGKSRSFWWPGQARKNRSTFSQLLKMSRYVASLNGFTQPSPSVQRASVPALFSTEYARDLEVLESSALFIGCSRQMELPRRSEGFLFPNNRKQAASRFYCMERRLSLPENQQYAEKYNNIVNKLIECGTASNLPHHLVEYPNKPGRSGW